MSLTLPHPTFLFIIQIITNVLKAAGELKPPVVAHPPTTSRTSAGTGTEPSSPNVFGVRPVVPDANSVPMPLNMSLLRSAAELAHSRIGSQLDGCMECLLARLEVDAGRVYEQECGGAATRAAAVVATRSPVLSFAADATGEPNATQSSTTQSDIAETSQDESVDIEDDKPSEEEKKEQDYKMALGRLQEQQDPLSKAREELKVFLMIRSLELIRAIDEHCLSPLLLTVEGSVSLSDELTVVADVAAQDGESAATAKEMKEDIVFQLGYRTLAQQRNSSQAGWTGDLQSYACHTNVLGSRDLDIFFADTSAISRMSNYDSVITVRSYGIAYCLCQRHRRGFQKLMVEIPEAVAQVLAPEIFGTKDSAT
ncbi:hypothetical protein BGX23_009567 [Mortierella sp. AD031]|nr:hypothetical protein BGX23_009567 [Mortierella sp. AD031]